uniref:Putative secreted protein n=1 Tax=Anopheles darlingi TaxID=43151 RepID=A0A2M4DGQ5_ANODA
MIGSPITLSLCRAPSLPLFLSLSLHSIPSLQARVFRTRKAGSLARRKKTKNKKQKNKGPTADPRSARSGSGSCAAGLATATTTTTMAMAIECERDPRVELQQKAPSFVTSFEFETNKRQLISARALPA